MSGVWAAKLTRAGVREAAEAVCIIKGGLAVSLANWALAASLTPALSRREREQAGR